MRLILTQHARKRIRERNVFVRWIRAAVQFPDQIVELGDGRREAIKRIDNNTLHVIYSNAPNGVVVITVLWE